MNSFAKLILTCTCQYFRVKKSVFQVSTSIIKDTIISEASLGNKGEYSIKSILSQWRVESFGKRKMNDSCHLSLHSCCFWLHQSQKLIAAGDPCRIRCTLVLCTVAMTWTLKSLPAEWDKCAAQSQCTFYHLGFVLFPWGIFCAMQVGWPRDQGINCINLIPVLSRALSCGRDLMFCSVTWELLLVCHLFRPEMKCFREAEVRKYLPYPKIYVFLNI